MYTFKYAPITTHQLSHKDLRLAAAEADADGVVAEAYRISIWNGGTPVLGRCEALYLPGDRRLGIANGGDATWASMTLENGIETWLNDPDTWEAWN